MVDKGTVFASSDEVAELERVNQCTRCHDWFHIKVLRPLSVGTENKQFCVKCIKTIHTNSKEQGL